MFDSIDKLLLGLFSGIIFGFLLQKGQVAKYNVIMGQLLLRDWTVLKIMMTAVAVGAVGVYALHAMGVVRLEIKPANWGGVISGAVLFGIGLAVLGLCPGTSVAASGEGHKDAMMGVLGMFFGSLAFVALFPLLTPVIQGWGSAGKVTLPELTRTSAWLWVAGVAAAALLLLPLLRHKEEPVY